MAIYKKQCIDWGNQIRQKIQEFYEPRIKAVEALISKAKTEGQDPSKVSVMGGLASIDYVALLQKVRDAASAASKEAEKSESKCDSEAVPDWLSDPQKASDVAVAIAILPFIELTKNYAAAHIDLAKIYQGYPLGSDNALIPKVREDVLKALHITGDAANFIRDPIQQTANLIQNSTSVVLNAANDALHKAKEAAEAVTPPILRPLVPSTPSVPHIDIRKPFG